jgi:Fe-S-cluster containining protein
MTTLTSADCQKCGLCCVSTEDQVSFADVTAKDEERLGKRYVHLHVVREDWLYSLTTVLSSGERVPHTGALATKWREQRSGPLRGISACTCVALRGSLLQKVSCAIYDKRPDVCRRAVKPGDRTCRQIRKLYQTSLENLT